MYSISVEGQSRPHDLGWLYSIFGNMSPFKFKCTCLYNDDVYGILQTSQTSITLYFQGSVLDGLESWKSQFSCKNLYRHSVSNPTFYIADRTFKLERNFSEHCSENIEVNQEQELNKRL